MNNPIAKTPWTPHPADLSEVRLTAQLEALVERLAQNIHDVWAQERLASGWRYGPRRDDEARETPCLVPYEALPEEEKFYDRRIADQTLRMILSLGYQLSPPSPRV